MTERDTRTPRLYLEPPLSPGAERALSAPQAHYLVDVLRLKPGDPVRLFNGQDGEWLAFLSRSSRKQAVVRIERHIANAVPPPDIDYVFAPLKHSRLDYLVQKATEMGARRLRPVITERTVATRVNLDRLRANVIEAAEQCNLVFLPEVTEPVTLGHVLAQWEPERAAIWCDETAPPADPIAVLARFKLPAAVIVGPEGGFAGEEREELRRLPVSAGISLGPRIVRADTAVVAALALVQAVLGDWCA